MALIVEDGSGLPNSNSYIDITFADTYFSDRGNTEWAALDTAAKEVALILATSYIDMRFCGQFTGYPVFRTQALQWPRLEGCKAKGWWIPSDEIPAELQRATAEYALQAALNGSLIESGPSNGTASPTIGDRIKVGPVEVENKYQDSSAKSRVTGVDVVSSSLIPEYPIADMMLQCILDPSDEAYLYRG